jgi:daunorubicin resistance ABC transporter ATP-binding subunit
MDAELAVRAEGLVKRFGPTVALDGVDLAVPAGTVLGLLGPNGAGKTTMVRILATLLAPDAGRATVAGHDVVAEPDEVRRSLGLTGQFAAVDDALTGRENLVWFGRLRELSKPAAQQRAAELLATFDLVEAADGRVQGYSGGMRRRLDLAVSLVVEPEVLVLDEPTTGLDPRSRQALWDVVGELRSRGVAVLLTTQYLEEADRLADRISVVDRGRVIAEGTAHQLKQRVGGAAIAVVASDAADLPAIGEVVARAVGAEPAIEVEARRVTAPAADGVGALAGVAAGLRDRAVEVADIGLHRPSLDDVFLALTGQAPASRGDHGDQDDQDGQDDRADRNGSGTVAVEAGPR